MSLTVREVGRRQVFWQADSTTGGRMGFLAGGDRLWLDPFPGYAHERGPAEEAMRAVLAAWPSPIPVELDLLEYDGVDRYNACAPSKWDYNRGTGAPLKKRAVIVLYGKRTPPHPSYTRYLVAHEWGHHVCELTEAARGFRPHDGRFRSEYARRRGMRRPGARWHDSVDEVIACDFRVLVAGVQPGFWPHRGVPRPEEVDGLAEWWEDARAEVVDTA